MRCECVFLFACLLMWLCVKLSKRCVSNRREATRTRTKTCGCLFVYSTTPQTCYFSLCVCVCSLGGKHWLRVDTEGERGRKMRRARQVTSKREKRLGKKSISLTKLMQQPQTSVLVQLSAFTKCFQPSAAKKKSWCVFGGVCVFAGRESLFTPANV